MLYIGNAFSISMLEGDKSIVNIQKISKEEVKDILISTPFISAVGHSSTAEVLTVLLETKIETNRISISLNRNDKLIVFQLKTRIEEGKILTQEEILALPHDFYLVEIL